MIHHFLRLFVLTLILLLMPSCQSKKQDNYFERSSPASNIEEKDEQPTTFTIKKGLPAIKPQPATTNDASLIGESPAIPGLAPTLLPPPPPLPPFFDNLGMAVPDDDELASSNSDDDEEECCCGRTCNLAVSGLATGGPAEWFIIQTPTYPDTVAVSVNRNNGFAKGGITLTPTGVTVNSPGDYWVTFTAVMLNTNLNYTPLIPLFVIRNGVFDPLANNSQLGTVGSLPAGVITTLQGSGPLADIASGTTLSIVATNGGSPEPEPVTVIAWSMTLYKICD